MTIEEKAKESLLSARVIFSYNFDELTYTFAYKDGANGQKLIDIGKACNEFVAFLDYLRESSRANEDETEEWLEKFKKSIEK